MTQCHILKDSRLQHHQPENLKSHKSFSVIGIPGTVKNSCLPKCCRKATKICCAVLLQVINILTFQSLAVTLCTTRFNMVLTLC